MSDLRADLKAARIDAGLTQQEIAARLNMTRSSIANFERGLQRMPVDLVEEYADLVGLVIVAIPKTDLPAVESLKQDATRWRERANELFGRVTAARTALRSVAS